MYEILLETWALDVL